MTPLCELARKYQTDKGGEHYMYAGVMGDTCHAYTPKYWDLFKDRIADVKYVLEIGINSGASLQMWEEFFPNAKIIGLDINTGTLFNKDRIRCFFADQNNRASLLHAMAQAGPQLYDLIVDDGSHELSHQVLSANVLLPYLAVGGMYVIEDIQYDCMPETVTNHIPLPDGYEIQIVPCPGGVGKAHCDPGCPKCHGAAPEQLIVIHRRR